MSQRKSPIAWDVPAPFDLAICLLTCYIISGFERVCQSFGLTLIEVLASVDVSYIPEVIAGSTSDEAFGCWFYIDRNCLFGVDSLA